MRKVKIFLENHLLPISIIISLTFFIWHKILGQTFLGEGYFYFDKLRISMSLDIKSLFVYDNFAKIFFNIVIPIFRDNLFWYQFTALFLSAVLYISLYFILYKITKNKILSLTSAILFSANFIGSYEMLADGNYDRFVERVPNIIPAVFSFYFLFKYCKSKKIKDFLISFILFSS